MFGHRVTLLGAACLLLAAQAEAAGTGPFTAIDRLQQLRDQGSFEQGLLEADRLLTTTPDDVDLMLLKGQFLAFLGNYSQSLAVLDRAQSLAPDYLDLVLMRARVYGYSDDPEQAIGLIEAMDQNTRDHMEARLLEGLFALRLERPQQARMAFERVLQQRADHAQALVGLGDVARQLGDVHQARSYYEQGLGPGGDSERRLQVAPTEQYRWDVILAGDYSRLSKGNDSWKEASGEIGYRHNAKTRLGLGFLAAERFDERDLLGSLSLSHRVNDDASFYAEIAAAPGADFLPGWRIRTGGERLFYQGDDDFIGATTGFAEVTLAGYDSGTVRTLAIGGRQYSPAGLNWLTARLSGTLDESNQFDLGASVRLDWGVADGATVFVGAGHERDSEDQRTATTNSAFLGARFDLSDALSLTVSATVEDRPNGAARQSLGLAVMRRF